jgi:drug/metabolite transporter (DMT)-like permease
MFYQGFVVAGFCFIAWTTTLERYSPGRLVVLFFMTPLFGVLLSHILLGDVISVSLIAGAGLVAYGIYLVNKREPLATGVPSIRE